MKHTLLLIAAWVLVQTGFAQPSDNSFEWIQNRLIQYDSVMRVRYGSSVTLVRFETGILINDNNKLSDVMNRKLVKGLKYIIFAYADSKIRDLKLKIKSNGKNNEELFNKNVAQNQAGDYEIATLTPDSTDTYRFTLESDMNTDQTGRYGLLMWIDETTTKQQGTNNTTQNSPSNNSTATPSTDAKTFYSISSRRFCYYNASTKKYDKCQSANETSLFELNPSKTVFKHTTPSITSSYYVQKSTFNSNSNLYEYDVVSDVGNKYVFFLPVDGKSISILKEDGNNSYLITHYVKRKWSDKE